MVVVELAVQTFFLAVKQAGREVIQIVYKITLEISSQKIALLGLNVLA